MTLPTLNIQVTNDMWGIPSAGLLEYKYKPFFNKRVKIVTNQDLDKLSLSATKAKLSTDTPVELSIEESYDGSANLIINDRKNPPKLINSRFYLKDSKTYEIGDKKGNLDTNIYSEDNFNTETSLIKTVQTIVTIDFIGLSNGGKMPVGNYTFYFKLADADGNESDFIAESGKVVCHIGNINQPKYIRGGQLGENSGKGIQFKLQNLDLGYTYINVYYTKSTGDSINTVVSAYKVDRKFRINGPQTYLLISGYEDHQEISIEDLNVQYTDFDSVQSLTNCQNMTFAGNIENNYEVYKTLEKYSLFITPELVTEDSIGSLDATYTEVEDVRNGYEYYNAKNIYYKLGYWDQEIYRFGIVYILNDYTLSPVFNIRGIRELTTSTLFNLPSSVSEEIVVSDDGLIKGTLENNKGVFRINNSVADGAKCKPIGLKFNFHAALFSSVLEPITTLVKGFFIVRQQRIPTILAQAIGISTTKHGNFPTIPYKTTRDGKESQPKWLAESFLTKERLGRAKLGSSYVGLGEEKIIKNALLCPEATLRTEIFNTFFNSSEYVLSKAKYQLTEPHFWLDKLTGFHLSNMNWKSTSVVDETPDITTSLLLIEPEIELTRNGENLFSSKAGDGIAVYKNVDVNQGDYTDPSNQNLRLDEYNNSDKKIRGIFNTYLGASSSNIEQGIYYNIFEKGYDFDILWLDYFRVRMSDASPYFPVSDRQSLQGVEGSYTTSTCYRGDCYINTYTQRVNWNFIDSEMPTNTKIVDPYTWYKNFRVTRQASSLITNGNTVEKLEYNKLLPLFTYKFESNVVKLFSGDKDTLPDNSIIEVDGKGFKKYSEFNGVFGYEKINKPDVNAVGLGHWVTFKICSNTNLAMRDVDLTRPMEEAVHKRKRSFYPLESMEKKHNLPESRILNAGISRTSGEKYYFDMGDIPFFKKFFTTRIYYSNILQQASFVNGNRVFLTKNFQDYSLEYGALCKLIEWYGALVAVMEHGILLIPVNERAMMTNESGENVYINTDNVLPQNPKVISNLYGSLWADSVVKTSRYIYGFDTVAKKIWRTDGTKLELISDLKIQKFLNDHINLHESDKSSKIFIKSIKTHYNAFKSDVLFVFQTETDGWNLCWNELLEKWVTRYTWFPEFSENINSIFYTFANSSKHPQAKNYLYKHGFSGTLEERGKVLPTKWYDKQEPFEFEFVVTEAQGIQKIFNNLKIISNKVEPNSFIFEVVGDGFDWSEQKSDIVQLNKNAEQLAEEADLTGLGSEFKLIL